MWACPKCGRKFKRVNQGHYCGKAPENVDEYAQSQVPEAQAHIMALREMIISCVPGIKERIAWSMPLFEKDKHSISFAACKAHISLYLDHDIIESIRPEIQAFTIQKNAVYLPYARALPVDIIEKAVKQAFEAE